ncbi:MAG TPA: CoA transferase, partial [Gemmatimonadales bacterium]|nr:CoA transferase [Gemmatimonadales bacterium]
PPMKAGVALVDVIAGKDAAVAILAALAGRDRMPDAADRRISVSLAHTAVAALVNVAQNALVSGAEPRRWGNAHPNLVPYQLFDTADRPLVIAVGNDAQWRDCCRALGRDDLAAEPAYATNAGRVLARERLVDALHATLAARGAGEWLARLARHRVPAGVVRPVTEALAEVEATAESGVAPLPPAAVRRRPPRLDEHGEAVRRHGWQAFGT